MLMCPACSERLPAIHEGHQLTPGLLAVKKSHLKQNEVIRLEILNYQELSVKNLYEDAMRDPVLAKYLPTKERLSNKLPEREFFFGVLCTLRKKYILSVLRDDDIKYIE